MGQVSSPRLSSPLQRLTAGQIGRACARLRAGQSRLKIKELSPSHAPTVPPSAPSEGVNMCPRGHFSRDIGREMAPCRPKSKPLFHATRVLKPRLSSLTWWGDHPRPPTRLLRLGTGPSHVAATSRKYCSGVSHRQVPHRQRPPIQDLAVCLGYAEIKGRGLRPTWDLS
jgi:hypothetical protein